MTELKDQLLKIIGANSTALMADLADEFVRAPAEKKEAIQAGIDFERWLSGTCQECLDPLQKC